MSGWYILYLKGRMLPYSVARFSFRFTGAIYVCIPITKILAVFRYK